MPGSRPSWIDWWNERSSKGHGQILSVAFWLAKPAVERQAAEQQWVLAIMKDQPEIAAAENLAQEFRGIIKSRKAGDLDAWMKSAVLSC